MKRNKKIAVVIGATGKLGSVIHEHLRQAGYSVDEQWANIKHPDVREPNSFERLPEKIDLAVYAAGYNLIKNTEKDINQPEKMGSISSKADTYQGNKKPLFYASRKFNA